MPDETNHHAELKVDDKILEIPVVVGTEDERAPHVHVVLHEKREAAESRAVRTRRESVGNVALHHRHDARRCGS